MTRNATNSDVADALLNVLVSPNVSDSNGEAANVVDVIAGVSSAIRAHALAVESTGDRISDGLAAVAQAIDNLAETLDERGRA
jgi:hypothetical protein